MRSTLVTTRYVRCLTFVHNTWRNVRVTYGALRLTGTPPTIPYPYPRYRVVFLLVFFVCLTVFVTLTVHHDDTDLCYSSEPDDVGYADDLDSLVWTETHTFATTFDALCWAYTNVSRWETWSL